MRIAWTDTPASDKIHGEGLIFDQAAPCEPIEPVRIPLITNRPSTRVMYTCACTPGKPSIDFANYFLLFAEDVYLPREKEEEKRTQKWRKSKRSEQTFQRFRADTGKRAVGLERAYIV